MRPTLLLAAVLVAIPLSALAQEQTPAPAPTTPAEHHHLREARMGQGGRALGALKQAAESGADLSTLTPRIQTLVQLGEDLPGLFPAGSGGEGTGAKAEIWSDPEGFQRAYGRFRTATRALATAAAAGDRTAFLAAWTETRASCGGCHDSYRE